MSLTFIESKELEQFRHNNAMIELEKARQVMREEQRLIMCNIKLKKAIT